MGMKSILAAMIIGASIAPLVLAGDKDVVEEAFVAFMEMVKEDGVKKAIKEHGIDEREDKTVFAIKLPGELHYEVKDVATKPDEATVKAEIEYTKVTEKAGEKLDDASGKASTAAKVVSGDVAGAAGNAARNKAGDAIDDVDIKRAEKVKMAKQDGQWKVVVTDDFYKALVDKEDTRKIERKDEKE